VVGGLTILLVCFQIWWVLYVLGRLAIRTDQHSYPELIMHMTKSNVLLYI